MTVLLVGVGADTDHVQPPLQLDDSGGFEYIPIPETHPTSETTTYGTWPLEFRNGTADETVHAIRPRGENGEWIHDDEAIRDHPVHHDPNFQHLTYGDRRGGGGKGGHIVKHLEPGDVLGFYTGIKRDHDDDTLHRFLYGYMTVNDVHDLSSGEGEEYHNQLQQFPENAHTKRLIGGGKPKHDDIVIVDGTTPAQKLSRPIQMSERLDVSPWYKITDNFATQFNVRSGLKGICRKFPVVMDLDRADFIQTVHSFRDH